MAPPIPPITPPIVFLVVGERPELVELVLDDSRLAAPLDVAVGVTATNALVVTISGTVLLPLTVSIVVMTCCVLLLTARGVIDGDC